jgi:hypothetical protein
MAAAATETETTPGISLSRHVRFQSRRRQHSADAFSVIADLLYRMSALRYICDATTLTLSSAYSLSYWRLLSELSNVVCQKWKNCYCDTCWEKQTCFSLMDLSALVLDFLQKLSRHWIWMDGYMYIVVLLDYFKWKLCKESVHGVSGAASEGGDNL